MTALGQLLDQRDLEDINLGIQASPGIGALGHDELITPLPHPQGLWMHVRAACHHADAVLVLAVCFHLDLGLKGLVMHLLGRRRMTLNPLRRAIAYILFI